MKTYQTYPRYLGLTLLLTAFLSIAHAASITGSVIDDASQTPIAFANVLVLETLTGAVTNDQGNFYLDSLPAGQYTLQVSCVGYQTAQKQITLEEGQFYTAPTITLEPESTHLTEISVTPTSLPAALVVPVPSLQASWVKNLPSGQDVIQAMQVLPSVSNPPGLSNEINIRGGASVENRFRIDGVEVPFINHFNSAGTSGGVRSLLQSHLIKKASLHASYLPVSIGDAASSVLDFTLIDGDQETPQGKVLASTTDIALSWAGRWHAQRRHTLVMAARQSYLVPTLKLFGRPVLNQYRDLYLKTSWVLNDYHRLSFLGLGSYDRNQVNPDAPDSPSNQFIRDVTPQREQWHASAALTYQHLTDNMTTRLTISAYGIEQRLKRTNTEAGIFYASRRYDAQDYRLLVQAEHQRYWASGSLTMGGQLQHLTHDARLSVDWTRRDLRPVNSQSNGQALRWGGYVQLNQSINTRWHSRLGLRYDGSNDSPHLAMQFSPRLALSYQLAPATRLYSTVALYHQMPTPLSLMLRDSSGHFINRNHAKPLTARHYVLGLTLHRDGAASSPFLTAEVYHKAYRNYPVSLRDGVALINKGDGFVTLGNEPLTFTGKGRAFGAEITFHLPPERYLYGLLTYSLSRSAFYHAPSGLYRPSSVDTRHVLNLVLGKHLAKGWHIATAWRLQSGRPFTPWDLEASSLVPVWNESLGRGLLNYDRLNTQRLAGSYEVDLRIDKRFTLKNTAFKAILEVRNLSLLGNQTGQPILILDRGIDDQVRFTDADSSRYRIREIASEFFLFVPTITLSAEF